MGGGLVLVCAGHDSSGRAGIDADLQALAASGVGALPVITADTHQEGAAVLSIRPRAEARWAGEVRACHARARVWKSGLLAGAASVEAFAALVEELADGRPVVCDPVLAASGGERFLDGVGVAALRERLLPLGVVLTPNVPEAAELSGLDPEDLAGRPEARLEAAGRLVEAGAGAVLIKGGHGDEDPVVDLVVQRGEAPVRLEHPRVEGGSLRGSGCRFASCVAAGLARGLSLPDAARRAGEKVAAWIGERVCLDPGSR